MRRYGLVIIAGLLLLGLGIWLSQKVTHYEERVELGASPAARSNTYLAMAYFLDEQGIPVTWRPSLTRLPAPTAGQDTLILLSSDAQLIDQQHVELLHWVAQGGHLIVSAQHEPLNNTENSFMSSLGIKKQSTADLDLSESNAQNSPQSTTKKPTADLTRLYLENEQSPAYLALDTRTHLQDSDNRAHAWANSHAATHLLQLSHGQGLITVLNDFKLWQRTQIGTYDHAWLLWYLSQDTHVTLFKPPPQQGLFKLLWQYYAIACVVLLTLLLLSAWSAAPRFAPIRTGVQYPRRQLVEHLQASALFNLRYNGQRSLLLALQNDIKQRAHVRCPGFTQLAVTEQWRILQQLSRQPIALISQSMRPPATKKLSAQALTQHVARLQLLRNAL
jgi:hypothetical protein